MSHAETEGVPHEGEIIAGKYRVERILGIGGMGVVVAAQHIRLDEKVALKFLLSAALTNPEAVARFVREARAASKIKSEHVARVLGRRDARQRLPVHGDGVPAGDGPLGVPVQKHGALPFPQAVDYVLQACEALAEAHAIGIVHRDLKPANLFLHPAHATGELCVKVLDFGISKLTAPGADSVSMTRTTALMGSPLYMSPEQMVTSKGVDVRTDIWSLGVILFELVTARLPFDAQSVTELAIRIAMEPPTPLRSLRPDAPPGFEHLLARCLDKNRDQRFQTVADLAVALAEYAPPQSRLSVERVLGTLRRAGVAPAFQGGGTGDARGSGVFAEGGPALGATRQPVNAAGPGIPPQTAASWGQTGSGAVPAPKSHTGLAIGIAVVVLAAVTGAGAMVVSRLHANAATAAAAPPTSAASAPSDTPAAAAPPSTGAAASPAASSPAAPPAASTAQASPDVTPTAPAAKTETHAARAPGAHAPAPPAAAAPSPAAPPPATAKHPPNCNPPYIINAAGEHQYKPECL